MIFVTKNSRAINIYRKIAGTIKRPTSDELLGADMCECLNVRRSLTLDLENRYKLLQTKQMYDNGI